MLASLLPHSRLLTVHGWGHTSLVLSPCADAVVARYLLDGALPAPGTCASRTSSRSRAGGGGASRVVGPRRGGGVRAPRQRGAGRALKPGGRGARPGAAAAGYVPEPPVSSSSDSRRAPGGVGALERVARLLGLGLGALATSTARLASRRAFAALRSASRRSSRASVTAARASETACGRGPPPWVDARRLGLGLGLARRGVSGALRDGARAPAAGGMPASASMPSASCSRSSPPCSVSRSASSSSSATRAASSARGRAWPRSACGPRRPAGRVRCRPAGGSASARGRRPRPASCGRPCRPAAWPGRRAAPCRPRSARPRPRAGGVRAR